MSRLCNELQSPFIQEDGVRLRVAYVPRPKIIFIIMSWFNCTQQARPPYPKLIMETLYPTAWINFYENGMLTKSKVTILTFQINNRSKVLSCACSDQTQGKLLGIFSSALWVGHDDHLDYRWRNWSFLRPKDWQLEGGQAETQVFVSLLPNLCS